MTTRSSVGVNRPGPGGAEGCGAAQREPVRNDVPAASAGSVRRRGNDVGRVVHEFKHEKDVLDRIVAVGLVDDDERVLRPSESLADGGAEPAVLGQVRSEE